MMVNTIDNESLNTFSNNLANARVVFMVIQLLLAWRFPGSEQLPDESNTRAGTTAERRQNQGQLPPADPG